MRDSDESVQGDPETPARPETTSGADRQSASSPATQWGSRASRAESLRSGGPTARGGDLRGAIRALVDAVEALAEEPERDTESAHRAADEARRFLGDAPGGDDRRQPETAPLSPSPKGGDGSPKGGDGAPADAPGIEQSHQDLQRALE